MRRSAFTLLEMIFVIVILGIIAGGTFIQVSYVYEDMMQKSGSSELESEAKVIAEQITARLSSSIKESLVAMTGTDGAGCTPVSDKASLTPTNSYILAWVGRSDESNTGLWDSTINDYRGWSGFVDVGNLNSNTTSIVTSGSMLSYAEIVINDLTGATNTLSIATNSPVALYFKEDMTTQQSSTTCSDFGLDTTASPNKMFQVNKKSGTENTLIFPNNTPLKISEQYSLSYSAYAIERNATDNTLWLRSFRPWLGEHPSNDASPKLLGKNVSGFGFKWEGGLFRINVCVSKTVSGFPINVCKEKAVF